MADFCNWAMCCEEALPFSEGSFYNAYVDNINENAGVDLEGFFPQCVLKFVSKIEAGHWEGLASTLYDDLRRIGLETLADQVELEAIRNSPYMPAEQKRQREAAAIEKAEFVLQRSKTHKFPSDAGAMGTWLLKLSPSLLKAEGINCERVGRSNKGILWRIDLLKPPEVVEPPENTGPRNSRDEIYGDEDGSDPFGLD